MATHIDTARLRLRRWEHGDAAAALAVYAAPAVSRWLTPEVTPPGTVEAMAAELRRWRAEDAEGSACTGHWALQTQDNPEIVGAMALQYRPGDDVDLTLTWALAPGSWGRGYAAEAGDALIRWAIHEQGETEVYAVLPSDNVRAVATARRMGMELIEERAGGRFLVYRIRHGDLALAD